MNLGWIYAHMIEETARQVGHMDTLREITDGVTGVDRLTCEAPDSGHIRGVVCTPADERTMQLAIPTGV